MAALRVCPTPGCPQLLPPGARCATCRRASDRKRRPQGNPYSTPGHRAFREQVLALHPYCVCPGTTCEAHTGLCGKPSNVADHYPHERKALIEMGENPDDPKYGRGLCAPCHDRHTARTNPAGWNQRN